MDDTELKRRYLAGDSLLDLAATYAAKGLSHSSEYIKKRLVAQGVQIRPARPPKGNDGAKFTAVRMRPNGR